MKKTRNKSGDLTMADQSTIAALEEKCGAIYDPKVDGGPLKVGDVCVRAWKSRRDKDYFFSKNAVGALRKYRVVHVAPSGLFFLKEIDCRGRRISQQLYYPERVEYVFKYGDASKFYRDWGLWMLDPSQLDAILLGDDFDPNADGKEKAGLFVEVHEHNGTIRIDTESLPAAERFLIQMKPGEIYWKSQKSYITVESVKHDMFTIEADVTRSDNGKKLKLKPKDVMHRRFYREKPRSFWRETDQQ